MLKAVEWWRRASRNDVARLVVTDLVSIWIVGDEYTPGAMANLQLTAHKFVPECELYTCLVSVEVR